MPNDSESIHDRFGGLERRHMETAVHQARQCVSEAGKVSPKVGAVVVCQDGTVAAAYRGELAPGDHAEFTLSEKKMADAVFAGAIVYTTLEPCTKRGHTSSGEQKIPCADRLIERRIKHVVIGTLDPNPDIHGKGELRLREAGITISRFDPDLMSQLEELNREFFRDQKSRSHSVDSKASRLQAIESDCRELADELGAFVQERQDGEPPYPTDQEDWRARTEAISRYSTETQTLYARKFGGRACAVREALLNVGLSNSNIDRFFEHPTNIIGLRNLVVGYGTAAEKLRIGRG